MAQKSKFLQWIDYRVRVTIQDSRMFVGTFIAFDKHLNLVLADTEEYRRIKAKKAGETDKEMKRALGLIILRGENIVSITAEAPPNLQAKKESAGGPGKATAVNRASVAISQPQVQQPGVGGVAKGMGQMNQSAMMPTQKSTIQPVTSQLPGSVNLPGSMPLAPTMLPPNLGPKDLQK